MLRIGLSGGIGAGKSTVSGTFSEFGGIVVDGDVIAREVVEPGTEGLGKLVEAFGAEILSADGTLNRPALAAIAFSDDDKRATLNGIVHPLVGKRREELIAAAAPDAVIIEDIPLLVESQMAPMFPLVIIVHADEDLRVKRLIEHRGFSEDDARARIRAQASEEQRRAVADVWLDNSGSADELVAQARELWHQRILPFAHNVQNRQPAPGPTNVVPYDPVWPDQARRAVARLTTTCGHRARRVDHVGPTAVAGLDAKDVLDIQVTVESLDVADELAEALLAAGYPRVDDVTADTSLTDDAAKWQKRFHASADPGRPTNVHLRVDGWPNQQFALMLTAWLAADADARTEYTSDLHDAYPRACRWAEESGWRP
ncbi:dephospho-CoA kinase [Mycolicibacterium sp. F2034L]|uniref:dephospho-CoA kinase n=1 Tax=Mycolicibacterium sp. F2034L TaxID=2926422 RepID=UPI001FF54F5F|nr:dephospho-CoA kinase [Mycolicibacterium sp. F2034L]MCK0173296.1 dephospho-CoA kinase [Mycolicibacterium sp. F2034L]